SPANLADAKIPSGEKPSKGFLFAARVAHGHLHLYSEAHRGTERRSGRKTHFPESRLKRRKFAIPHESPLLATNSRIHSANSGIRSAGTDEKDVNSALQEFSNAF